MSVRSTPSVGSGSLFLLTPQLFDSTHLDPESRRIDTHCWPHFSISSRRQPALLHVCMHALLSMDGLLAMTLMKTGEGSGDARLFVSEILQALRVMKRNQSSSVHDFTCILHALEFTSQSRARRSILSSKCSLQREPRLRPRATSAL